MQTGTNIFVSLVAGAVGGTLAIFVFMNSQQGERILQPAPLEAPASSNDSNQPGSIGTEEDRIVSAVEKANPAVVSIVISKDVPVIEQYYEEVPPSPFNDFFRDDFFSPFNFQIPQYRQNGTERREVGGGSGFLVSSDGLIMTNRHVVNEDEVDYTVFTNDGTSYEAQILARDPVNDLAVLKIDGSNLPYLTFTDSDQLKVGQTVIAIGNALAEFRNTVSVGVVSGLSRSISASDEFGSSEQLEEVIQTDAAINPGNSGGPLLDSNGNVAGVNVAVVLGSENIGFALPANIARDILDSVEKTGRIVRPYIGVRYVTVTPPLVENNRLPVDYGALIVRGDAAEDLAVLPGSPAEKAGIVEGDILLEIDGVRLDENHSLASAIRNKNVGDVLRMKVLSKGAERDVSITLEEIPG